MKFNIKYFSNKDSDPLDIVFNVKDEKEAIKRARKLVVDGYINETFITIELFDRFYVIRNINGKADGELTKY